MSPFDRHNIRQLSPSSLALYRTAPALFILRYLYGVKDDAGAFAWRGRAVEAGLDQIIFAGAGEDEAIALALAAFDVDAAGEISDQIAKEREAIPGFVRQAAEVFRPLGRPVARQYRIELWLDGIEVPIVGYADYVYEEFVLDLKTAFALPAKPRPDHEVQVVCYGDATARRPGLVYVTPKKGARYPQDMIDVEGARRTLRHSALAVRAMLERSRDREHAAALFVPDPDDYRWTEVTRKAAQDVWS